MNSMTEQRLVSPVAFFISASVVLVTGSVLFWLIIGNVVTSDVGIGARITLILTMLAALIAALATTKVIPIRSRNFEDWRKPHVVGQVALIIYTTLGIVVGLTPLVSPPPATEATAVEARDAAMAAETEAKEARIASEGIKEALSDAGVISGTPTIIEENISGVWGEDDCSVTYRFSLKGQKLGVESLKSPIGLAPIETSGTVESVTGTVLKSTTYLPLKDRGKSVEFQYFAGAIEQLVWRDKTRPTSLTLDRCE